MHHPSIRTFAAALGAAALATTAFGDVTPPAGYIYSTQLLSNLAQGCVAAGPGGTFVGLGPGFTVNAQNIVLARESGELRLVASGFNSISDCAYDAAADVLYVTDNADSGELPGAISGDTVFAIPSASTASGVPADSVELLPANSVPTAASVAVDASGNVFVADAAGGVLGTVLMITPGPVSAPLVTGFDLTGGVAIDPATGNLFVAESLSAMLYQNQIRKFTAAGVAIMPDPLAGPSATFGSLDLAFNSDGRLLASGGAVVSFNPDTGASTPFISGLSFVGPMTVDPFTHRVQVLSSTFGAADEDKSLHRFTPIDQLSRGGGSDATDCLHEAYGLHVVDGTATCTDGAACDSDGKVNDVCVFPIGFCLNVADPGLTDCATDSNVTDITIAAKPDSPALAAAAAKVAAALPASGGCFFSDGLSVPVKITDTGKKDGKAKMKVKATAADGRRDNDTFKLVCHPGA